MGAVRVVHLVWKPLGLDPLRDFLASYQTHPAGLDHKLVVVFNGFDGEAELGEWREALAGVEHDWLLVSPPTQDIPAYFEAARRLDCEYLCFLNSYSVILDSEWLAKLHRHARGEGVGAVGATGSWQSHRSLKLFAWGERSAYTDILFDLKEHIPHEVPPARFALSEGREQEIRGMGLPRRLALRLYYLGLVAPYHLTLDYVRLRLEKRRDIRRFPAADFGPFPAYHLRTNAFMIRRDVMLGLKTWGMPEKDDAYRFESGTESMTNQLLRRGLKPLVVGRDGRAYEKEEWPLSETLFQGEQRNLLVSDNVTRRYAESGALERTILSRGAWGQASWTFPRAGGPGRAPRP